MIDNLNKTEILDEVLPMLISARSSDPVVLMPLLRMCLLFPFYMYWTVQFDHKKLTCSLLFKGIYKQMMSDKRYGLTINILATKVLPALTPVVVSPNLKLDEVSATKSSQIF